MHAYEQTTKCAWANLKLLTKLTPLNTQMQSQPIPLLAPHHTNMPHTLPQLSASLLASRRVTSAVFSERLPHANTASGSPRRMHAVLRRIWAAAAATGRGGAAAGSSTAHLEALSDSDEVDRRKEESARSVSSESQPVGAAADGGRIEGQPPRRAGDAVASGGGLGGAGAALGAQKGVVEAAKKSAGGDGDGGAKVGGAAGGAESEGCAREQALTSKDLTNMIQRLDEQITMTDAEIMRLQARAGGEEGAIFGMQAPKTAVKSKFACTIDELINEHGKTMLEHNRKMRTKRVEAVAKLGCRATLALRYLYATPLYTCVEDSPYVQRNIDRHKIVEPHIEAHVRRLTKERRHAQLKQAANCRSKTKVCHPLHLASSPSLLSLVCALVRSTNKVAIARSLLRHRMVSSTALSPHQPKIKVWQTPEVATATCKVQQVMPVRGLTRALGTLRAASHAMLAAVEKDAGGGGEGADLGYVGSHYTYDTHTMQLDVSIWKPAHTEVGVHRRQAHSEGRPAIRPLQA